jgi:outer membrane protein assembly factor BamB
MAKRATRFVQAMFVSSFLAVAANVTAAQGDTLPPPVAREMEGKKGICLDLDCGDASVTAAVAKRGEFLVLALAKDEKVCENARELLDKAEVHGSQAIVTVGSCKQIPLPNGYCNLIVAGRLPPDIDFKEIVRVLNPNGVAVLGGINADAGKLKAEAVKAGVLDCKIDENYLVVRGKMPAGSDDWTHVTRGPDNNLASIDASIRPPFRTQWLASLYGRMLVAQGRTLIRPHTFQNSSVTKQAKFVVRDSMNGTALWERVGREMGFWPDDMVMAGDKIYAIEDRNSAVALDAATGKELAAFKAPPGSDADCGYWFRLAFQNEVLYVVGLKEESKVEWESPLSRMGYVLKKDSAFGVANRFFAFDARTGRLLWVCKPEKPTNFELLGFGPDAAFAISELGMVAFNLKTGAQLWHNPDVVTRKGMRCLPLLYHEGRVHIFWEPPHGGAGSGPNGSATVDAKTGSLAYTIPEARGLVSSRNQLCIGNTLYLASGNGFTGSYQFNTYDNATGRKLPEVFLAQSSNGCRPFTGSPSCLGGQFGIMDLTTKEWFSFDTDRVDCTEGLLFANSLIYYTHTYGYTCPCPFPMRATVTMAPAGSWTPPKVEDVKAAAADRLKKGSAFAAALGTEASSDDWPSYRHDSWRTAGAKSAVGLPVGKGWQKKLAGLQATAPDRPPLASESLRDPAGRLTPASVAAGLVFTASSGGRIWALDVASGEIKWTYLCGGGIKTTPTYWKGRLFAGSNDGWVYCLDAATGNLAWRFQAAPQDYFLSAKGRLFSMWPVLGGVVVDDDTAYFAAGMCSIDGSYLCAVDATTGRLKWVKDVGHLSKKPLMDPKTGGAGPKGGFIGLNPYGALALKGDLLYVPNGKGRPGLFRKADGEPVSWAGINRDGANSGGGEVVIAGDEFFNGGDALIGSDGAAGIGSGDALSPFMVYQTSSGQAHTVGGNPVSLSKTTPAPTPTALYTIQGGGLRAYSREKLAVAYPLKAKERAEAEAAAILWTNKNIPVLVNDGFYSGMGMAHTVATSGPQILVVGTSEVFVYDETGQKILAKFKVGGKIIRNGLSIAHEKAYVVTEEGSVFCLGSE